MGDLVLYTHPTSRGRTVRWMLHEVGAEYRAELLEYGPPMKAPEYLAINPMGKVPTLRHGDVVVTEVAAILTYLADLFPSAGLAPDPNSPERGPYYRWLFFAAGPLEYAITMDSMELKVPEGQSDRIGFGSSDLVLDTLDAHLQTHEYMVGDRFTAADVLIGGHHIAYGLEFGLVPSRPSFEAYAQRVIGRPAFRAAAEIDDRLMPAQSG